MNALEFTFLSVEAASQFVSDMTRFQIKGPVPWAAPLFSHVKNPIPNQEEHSFISGYFSEHNSLSAT